MKTLTQMLERIFFEPTPKFFSFLRRIAISIGAISLFVIGLEKNGFHVPQLVSNVINFYTLNSALIAVLITSLTSTWRNADGSINEQKKQRDIAKQDGDKYIQENIGKG